MGDAHSDARDIVADSMPEKPTYTARQLEPIPRFQPPQYRGYPITTWTRELRESIDKHRALVEENNATRSFLRMKEEQSNARVAEALREARMALGLRAAQMPSIIGLTGASALTLYMDAEDGAGCAHIEVDKIADELCAAAELQIKDARRRHNLQYGLDKP